MTDTDRILSQLYQIKAHDEARRELVESLIKKLENGNIRKHKKGLSDTEKAKIVADLRKNIKNLNH